MKALEFIGSSRKDLKGMPTSVRQDIGYALYQAQEGGMANNVKVLKGFAGSGFLEVIEDFNRDTYRAVYTVKYSEAIYVLHCFKKKSKSGIATPQADIRLMKERAKRAQEHYFLKYEKPEGGYQ